MNKEFINKQLLPVAAGILIFIAVILTYFHPLLEGKRLQQDDIVRHKGMSKELADFRTQTGTEALWTNSMFGGMPAFQISTLYKGNLTTYFDKIFQLGLPHPANLVFLYALGFFILLLTLRINPWLSIAGSLGYAFSSYFFIILIAGHNSKAHAIAYMAPVIAGILLSYRGKYLLGAVITMLALSLEISANHLQITYYLMIMIIILFITQLIMSVINKQIPSFIKASAFLFIGALIAIGPNISNLWTTYEYSNYTIRGKSDLTLNKANQTSGLDKDYATAWSYGVGESFTLLIPDFKGGSSRGELSESSECYKVLEANQVPNSKDIIKGMPLYWGQQPFTSGPVYAGAIFIFLFVLGLFIVKGPEKWWLLSATVASIMLAWGHNFYGLTNFFLEHVPAYNKFRAVAMILVIAQFCIPLLGMLAIQQIFNKDADQKKNFTGLKIALGITGGLCLIFALIPGTFFDFTSADDAQLKTSGFPDWLITALISDRESLLKSDSFRSLIFILLTAAGLWAVIYKKIKPNYFIIAFIVLVIADMWPVNLRYLNTDSFVRKSVEQTPYTPTAADEIILKDPDPNYRVLNLTVNTFNDASTSYFHKSIGGYHGAKLRRFQELKDYQIDKNNMSVLNMLNTKYFIVKGENNAPTPQQNPNALGNAWFAANYKFVPNADSELLSLTTFDPKKIAFIDQIFKSQLSEFKPGADTTASIKLTSYKPNDLQYDYKSSTNQLCLFSEMYYDKGWNAFIDGKAAPHFRADYVLRAMVIPAGDHKIEFKFEPNSYIVGEKVSFASSILIILLVLGFAGFELRGIFSRK